MRVYSALLHALHACNCSVKVHTHISSRTRNASPSARARTHGQTHECTDVASGRTLQATRCALQHLGNSALRAALSSAEQHVRRPGMQPAARPCEHLVQSVHVQGVPSLVHTVCTGRAREALFLEQQPVTTGLILNSTSSTKTKITLSRKITLSLHAESHVTREFAQADSRTSEDPGEELAFKTRSGKLCFNTKVGTHASVALFNTSRPRAAAHANCTSFAAVCCSCIWEGAIASVYCHACLGWPRTHAIVPCTFRLCVHVHTLAQCTDCALAAQWRSQASSHVLWAPVAAVTFG